MALLMALLLMALLVGPVLHSLTAARMALRAAERQREVALLRIAAADAAWSAFRAEEGGKQLAAVTPKETEMRWPSGVMIRSAVRPMDRAAVPGFLLDPKAPVFGACFAVTASARNAWRTLEVRGIGCRLPTGEVRILCWTESS